jgi:hypothetical protein
MRSRGTQACTIAEMAKPSTSAHHTCHAIRKAFHRPSPSLETTSPTAPAALSVPPHQAGGGGHELPGLLLLEALGVVDDAVARVVVHQAQSDLVDRRLDEKSWVSRSMQ